MYLPGSTLFKKGTGLHTAGQLPRNWLLPLHQFKTGELRAIIAQNADIEQENARIAD
jgi:hypothetical protein